MKPSYLNPKIFAIATLSFAPLLFSLTPALAADEVCTSCGPQVSVSGSFVHSKSEPSMAIEGAPGNAADFREDVGGTNFTITISGLPAGEYKVAISAAEVTGSGPGERVFDVLSGDAVLARNFDIVAAAGAQRKVASITGSVDHADEAIRGPLRINFVSSKGNAKFNTVEVKNADGASVVSFKASELADAFSAAASRVPDVKEPMIWRDPSRSGQAQPLSLCR